MNRWRLCSSPTCSHSWTGCERTSWTSCRDTTSRSYNSSCRCVLCPLSPRAMTHWEPTPVQFIFYFMYPIRANQMLCERPVRNVTHVTYTVWDRNVSKQRFKKEALKQRQPFDCMVKSRFVYAVCVFNGGRKKGGRSSTDKQLLAEILQQRNRLSNSSKGF